MNDNYQAQFQLRWRQLTHPHVRSLAWLLDSPILLNAAYDRWENQLAELPPVDQITSAWLLEMENNPERLTEFLAVHPQMRLGHYAEKLLAFYFSWRGELVAHGVQVQSRITIGEFDFLLAKSDGLAHWEFACKFYILVAPGNTLSNYVGPNLMDNLNDKSGKIINAQLALGQHPEAQKYLPSPLNSAKALLKGWLFYPSQKTDSLIEVTPQHCRGLWRRLSELNSLTGKSFTILSRLQWLAPAKTAKSQTMDFDQMKTHLTHQFLIDTRPVLIAQLAPEDGFYIETERIFVVPDAWNCV